MTDFINIDQDGDLVSNRGRLQGVVIAKNSSIRLPLSLMKVEEKCPICLNGERDFKKEEMTIRRGKAKLCLLSTLIGKKRAEWLYRYEKSDNFLEGRCFDIQTNGERWGRAYNIELNSRCSLMDVFVEEKRIDDHDALTLLEKDFNYTTNSFPNIQQKLIPVFFDNFHITFNPEITFEDIHKVQQVEVLSSSTEPSYFLCPASNWQGKSKPTPIELTIPHPKAPLLNLKRIQTHDSEESPIILTSNLLAAFSNTEDSNFVWTGWYGEANGISHTDFSPLENKSVLVLIDNAENFPDLQKKIVRKLHSHQVKLKGILLTNDDLTRTFNKNEYITHECNFISMEHIPRTKKSKKNFLSYSELATQNSPTFWFKPTLLEGSIIMLYAPPGVGKTWLSLSLALASATGKKIFPTWKNNEKYSTIYLDGEMGEAKIGNRIKLLSNIYGKPDDDKFIYYRKTQVKIECKSWQKEFEQEIKQLDLKGKLLLFFDNWSTLCTSPDSEQSWNSVFNWFIKLKRKHITIILIHHSNKSGDQRGSSLKTANVDTIIKLDSGPKKQGISFSINFEKNRDLPKQNSRTDVTLETSSKPKWITPTSFESKEERNDHIVKLKDSGHRAQEIADLVGCSRETVYRVLKNNR